MSLYLHVCHCYKTCVSESQAASGQIVCLAHARRGCIRGRGAAAGGSLPLLTLGSTKYYNISRTNPSLVRAGRAGRGGVGGGGAAVRSGCESAGRRAVHRRHRRQPAVAVRQVRGRLLHARLRRAVRLEAAQCHGYVHTYPICMWLATMPRSFEKGFKLRTISALRPTLRLCVNTAECQGCTQVYTIYVCVRAAASD